MSPFQGFGRFHSLDSPGLTPRADRCRPFGAPNTIVTEQSREAATSISPGREPGVLRANTEQSREAATSISPGREPGGTSRAKEQT